MNRETCTTTPEEAFDPKGAPIPWQDSIGSIDSSRSWYVLAILSLSYALAFIDRQLLNLILDPIKHTLSVSDTELSLIQGAAFVLAYLVTAPLFGRLVDVTNRRNVLLFGICAWSIFTAFCGRADTYVELFIARVGVGASEACVFPVGCSLIGDYFSERRTPRAISIFMASQWVGAGFSLVAGGLVIAFANDMRLHFPLFEKLAGWQMAFVLVGLPGLLLAVAVLLTVREPTRKVMLKAAADDRQFTIREASAFLWANRGFYARIYIGVGMLAMVVLGMPAWAPSFLIRFHGVAPSLVGYRLGILAVVFGSTGVLLGPTVARLLERRGHTDAQLRAAAFSMIGTFFFCAAIPLAPSPVTALVAIAGAIFSFSLPIGIMAAATQLCTPSRLRGSVASLYTFFSQLIGFGIGPTAIALVTDKVFGNPRMVGYSLGIVCCVASALASWLIFAALPHYRRMLQEERYGGPGQTGTEISCDTRATGSSSNFLGRL